MFNMKPTSDSDTGYCTYEACAFVNVYCKAVGTSHVHFVVLVTQLLCQYWINLQEGGGGIIEVLFVFYAVPVVSEASKN
jgi:hypothetical protein